MKFLKRQNTNIRNIAGAGVIYDVNGQVVLDSSNVVLVPKGPTGDRPGELGVITSPTNGQLRYNTSDNEFEGYQNGQWRKMRFKEPTAIHVESFGGADDIETVFGPLNSNDPDYPDPTSAASVLVLIENVLQIPGTNYTLEQSDGTNVPSVGPNPPYAAGYYIVFGTPPPTGKTVTVIHNFDK